MREILSQICACMRMFPYQMLFYNISVSHFTEELSSHSLPTTLLCICGQGDSIKCGKMPRKILSWVKSSALTVDFTKVVTVIHSGRRLKMYFTCIPPYYYNFLKTFGKGFTCIVKTPLTV